MEASLDNMRHWLEAIRPEKGLPADLLSVPGILILVDILGEPS